MQADREHIRGVRSVQLGDIDLNFRSVAIEDATPTGMQLAIAAGFKPADETTVLAMLPGGGLEDVSPNEVADAERYGDRFIVVKTDRSFRLTVDGQRFDWPAGQISGGVIRKLTGLAASKSIYFERQDQPDQLVEDTTVVNLGPNGVEAFHSRSATWVLNVQGVRLELQSPTIVASQAMTLAGFDINQGWHIYLKVVGKPKEALELSSLIDLRAPGIEKLRLTLKDVSNGEPSAKLRREFRLLDVDESFLDKHFASWESALDGPRRWILIPGYQLPAGFSRTRVTLALEVPTTYPGAQIDMFFCEPPLTFASGLPISQTDGRVVICGTTYQQWSRHRGSSFPWRPESDNVVTHLALVESSLAKEVAE